MLETLFGELSREEWKIRAVPVSRLPELNAEIDGLHASGQIGDERYGYLVQGVRFDPAEAQGLPTVLTVAFPSPLCRVVFLHNGRTVTAYIPPTYKDYRLTPQAIGNRLNGILGKYGYRAAVSGHLPEKLLAARSGLIEYGRNNIAYTQGLGSFIYLSSYYTDMPSKEDTWGPARRMNLCDTCKKCVEACPTGAIAEGRNIVDITRCLTLYNEADSCAPFPEWIPVSAHNSVIGCVACQLACPMNAKRLDFTVGPVEFDEEETARLMDGAPPETLPEAMKAKMDVFDMMNYIKPMARNLKALFEKR